jgi:single-strand DNA-binding protein
MSLNKVMLIGNVGKDPEIRYLEGNNPAGGNTKVAQFTLATTERYRDRSGELRENTEWHNIVAWRNNADVAEKYIRRGTQLYIEGRIRTRSWTDQTGNKRFTTEIVADTIQLLGKRSDNPGADGPAPYPQAQQPYQQARQPYPQAQQPYQQVQQPAAPQAAEGPEDDLPF